MDHGGKAPTGPEIQVRLEQSAALLPPDALCDICGYPMLDIHCKLICRHCGFMRDCSDP